VPEIESQAIQTVQARSRNRFKRLTNLPDGHLQIHDQIEQIQGNVTLDAFEGAVMVYARRLDGTTLEIDEYNVPVTPGDPTEPMKIRAVKLEPGQTYDLIVVLDRNATSAQDRIVETFSTGESTDGALRSVAFDIELKGRGIRLAPKNQTLDIDARSQSSSFVRRFVAPEKAGRYDIFAEVSQKNRLVKVALLPALIEGSNV
jgi:hypothetical protein